MVAPVSALLVRAAGTKLTTAAGVLIVAAGLWQISGATTAYRSSTSWAPACGRCHLAAT